MTAEGLLNVIEKNFSIERYKGCRDLGAVGWCNELHLRKMLFEGFGNPTSSVIRHQKEELERILVAPLYSIEDELLFVEADYSSVEDLSILDVFDYHEWSKQLPGFQEAWSKLIKDDAEEENVPPQMAESFHSTTLVHDEDIFFKTVVPVRIDLSATDEQITQEFLSWLLRKRSELVNYGVDSPTFKRFARKDFALWDRWRVLAFIDLTFIEQFHLTKIPNHIKGRMLFPRESDVDMGERIRKVVKPLAERIISEENIWALVWTALHSIEQKSE